jgi:hypothetical protein
MTDRRILMWGKVPVPYAASWTEEAPFFIGLCPYSRREAICQTSNRGQGKPLFGKPHANRQRELIALNLCDLCAKPLKVRTKVSLSHARPQPHAFRMGDILQVEPMLHRDCAATCVEHCPSLKRDIDQGTLIIRQVFRHAVQFAIMDEVYTEHETGRRQTAVGNAKVQLIEWAGRDLNWLRRAA